MRKKMPSFLQKYGFENARKNLRPFSQIFGPGPFAGSFSQNLTPGDVFFSLQQSLLSWLCSQNVSPACQQNVLCEKAAKPSKEFWWCLLGMAPFAKTTVKKWKKSHDEVLHWAWRKNPRKLCFWELGCFRPYCSLHFSSSNSPRNFSRPARLFEPKPLHLCPTMAPACSSSFPAEGCRCSLT